MKIPKEQWAKAGEQDADFVAFFEIFDQPQGACILEAGAHDSPVCNILANNGFKVTGVDLRTYDPDLPPCNYEYIRCDWCDMPISFWNRAMGTYDAFVSLSTIEHFGFNAYGEGKALQYYYDVIAMRMAWMLLKEGGMAYITVPFGEAYSEFIPHWRVYNIDSLLKRLVGDFTVEGMSGFVSGQCEINGVTRQPGEFLTPDECTSYSGAPPHVTIIAVLKKISRNRLAPDGR